MAKKLDLRSRELVTEVTKCHGTEWLNRDTVICRDSGLGHIKRQWETFNASGLQLLVSWTRLVVLILVSDEFLYTVNKVDS